jgi:hypothetical protein
MKEEKGVRCDAEEMSQMGTFDALKAAVYGTVKMFVSPSLHCFPFRFPLSLSSSCPSAD